MFYVHSLYRVFVPSYFRDKMLQNYKSDNLEIIDWGCLEYGEAFSRQRALVDESISGFAPDRLVFVEHPPVVTIGRSGSPVDLKIPEETLRKKGVSLYQSNRGGMVTFLEILPVYRIRREILIPFNNFRIVAFGEDGSIPDCFGHIKLLDIKDYAELVLSLSKYCAD